MFVSSMKVKWQSIQYGNQMGTIQLVCHHHHHTTKKIQNFLLVKANRWLIVFIDIFPFFLECSCSTLIEFEFLGHITSIKQWNSIFWKSNNQLSAVTNAQQFRRLHWWRCTITNRIRYSIFIWKIFSPILLQTLSNVVQYVK